MLIILSIVALVNVVLLTVTCCMLYLLMKKRVQAATAPCSTFTDAEKGPNVVTALAPVSRCSDTYMAQSTNSLGSLNSAEQPNLCPTPKRTPFGGTRKPIGLNETFTSSMSSMSHSLSREGLANLNAQLEALKNQRNLNDTFTSSRSSLGLNLGDLLNRCTIDEEDNDSGYGSGISSVVLGKALDEVLDLYNNLEVLKAQQKPSRPRSMSLSLPRLSQTHSAQASYAGVILDPNCLNMEF